MYDEEQILRFRTIDFGWLDLKHSQNQSIKHFVYPPDNKANTLWMRVFSDCLHGQSFEVSFDVEFDKIIKSQNSKAYLLIKAKEDIRQTDLVELNTSNNKIVNRKS